jgi:aminomethyltransferase
MLAHAPFGGPVTVRTSSGEHAISRELAHALGGEPFRMWLEDFWDVRRDGQVVGRLVSASHSFRLKENVGYAWVPIELVEPGNELEVLSPDGPVQAVTAALPFLDPNKDIPKQ